MWVPKKAKPPTSPTANALRLLRPMSEYNMSAVPRKIERP